MLFGFLVVVGRYAATALAIGIGIAIKAARSRAIESHWGYENRRHDEALAAQAALLSQLHDQDRQERAAQAAAILMPPVWERDP